MAIQRTTLVSTGGEGHSLDIPTSIRPEDLIKTIDATKASIERAPEPGLLERLTSAGARERMREIEQVRTGEIRARRVLIDNLIAIIGIYVGAHVGDLRVRTQAMLNATIMQLAKALYAANEDWITSFFETWSAEHDRIMAIKNLTDEQKREQIAEAYQRALDARATAKHAYAEIIEQMRAHVVSIIREIEQIPTSTR